MLHTPHSALHTLHSTLYTLRCILHTLHSTLYTFHSTLHTLHVALRALYFSLQTLHSFTSMMCPYLTFWNLYHYHMCEHSGSWAASGFLMHNLCAQLPSISNFLFAKYLSLFLKSLKSTIFDEIPIFVAQNIIFC